ncbi:MAG TPA: hypothetical protein VFS97_13740 [Nitrososphaeraceae archaeon]|nr:hypothetical protein [Nitrososphaeraceae archaeon]
MGADIRTAAGLGAILLGATETVLGLLGTYPGAAALGYLGPVVVTAAGVSVVLSVFLALCAGGAFGC